MRVFPLIIFLSFLAVSLLGQATFKASNHLINNEKVRSTLSIGIADLNGDYKDDIILLDNGTDLITAYQNGPDAPYRVVHSGQILGEAAWALSLGDITNDGKAELFACGVGTYGNIFRQNQDGSYGFIQILYGLTFPQNSNMADIDNDGFLDLFVCDERAYNDLYINDRTGKMIYTDYIDMYTIPQSDNSGNYGSEWVDFDDDRDLDLFITKCKPGIESPESPLRINVLFENDGTYQYTEQADKWGLKNGDQSWTGSFGDVDNDGDLDCYVSNHDVSHILYRNIENDTFVDVTQELGIELTSASFQAGIRDFDNNGFMDIYVTGDKDYMYWNHGQDNWTIDEKPFGELQVFTFAAGDLNDDGFLDVITGHGRLNEPGNYDDVVWINQGNENHFLKISFLGEQSNRQGVGSKVKLYSDLGIQIRDVKIGESYGTTNSANVHFGLGSVEEVDSMIVYWPSGQEDRYYDIPVDQHILLNEGKCMNPFINIIHDGDNILCEGETLTLSVEGDYAEYHWSTGETTSSIVVSSSMDVSFKGVDQNGCIHHSNILRVEYNPEQIPEINILQGGRVNCPGDKVILSVDEAFAYNWSNGSDTPSIEVVENGNFMVTVSGHCGDFISDEIDIEFFEAPLPQFENDTIFLSEEGIVHLTASGEGIYWFSSLDDADFISTGSYVTDTIKGDTVFYASNYARHKATTESVGMEKHMGTPLGGSSLNSGIVFNVFQPLVLEEVKVIADVEGIRKILLQQIDEIDGTAYVLDSAELFIPEGEQYINLDFELDEGLNYVLTTDGESNKAQFGFKSPAFYRSNEGVAFPYVIDDLIELKSTLHGLSYYYYFYDWQVRPLSVRCFSEKLPLYVVIDSTVQTEDVLTREGSVVIYPNPVGNQLNIVAGQDWKSSKLMLSIFDIHGKVLKEGRFKQEVTLDISDLSSGVYLLSVQEAHSSKKIFKKFIRKE